MKIQLIAGASVIAFAMASPALASDAGGFYVGLGAGWDSLSHVHVSASEFNGTTNVSESAKVQASSTALVLATAGYSFSDQTPGYDFVNHVRVEGEVGWDQHSVGHFGANSGSGHYGATTLMTNVLYDIPITNGFGFSIGAGVGAALKDVSARRNGVGVSGSNGGFAYQGIAGFSYALFPNIDLTLDYRYRYFTDNETYSNNLTLPPLTPPAPGVTTHVGDGTEQVVMVGVRWYP